MSTVKDKKSLSDILEENDLLNEEGTGINIERKEEAFQVFYNFPNNFIIGLYGLFKYGKGKDMTEKIFNAFRLDSGSDERENLTKKIYNNLSEKGYRKTEKTLRDTGKVVNILKEYVNAKVYFGGAMTRENQESFALIANEDPHRLTIKNSILSVCLSPQYFGMAKGGGWLGGFVFSSLDSELSTYVGLGLASGIFVANIVRGIVSHNNKKAYASIGLDGLGLNLSTYYKKAKNNLSENTPEYGEFVKNSIKSV